MVEGGTEPPSLTYEGAGMEVGTTTVSVVTGGADACGTTVSASGAKLSAVSGDESAVAGDAVEVEADPVLDADFTAVDALVRSAGTGS